MTRADLTSILATRIGHRLANIIIHISLFGGRRSMSVSKRERTVRDGKGTAC